MLHIRNVLPYKINKIILAHIWEIIKKKDMKMSYALSNDKFKKYVCVCVCVNLKIVYYITRSESQECDRYYLYIEWR